MLGSELKSWTLQIKDGEMKATFRCPGALVLKLRLVSCSVQSVLELCSSQ